MPLLDRLRDCQTETLLFIHDRNVRWSNNPADWDLRPMKILQKVSGRFRAKSGGVKYCRINFKLSTTAKDRIDPCDVIAMVLAGKPWLPKAQGSASQISR